MSELSDKEIGEAADAALKVFEELMAKQPTPVLIWLVSYLNRWWYGQPMKLHQYSIEKADWRMWCFKCGWVAGWGEAVNERCPDCKDQLHIWRRDDDVSDYRNGE